MVAPVVLVGLLVVLPEFISFYFEVGFLLGSQLTSTAVRFILPNWFAPIIPRVDGSSGQSRQT